MERRIQSVPGHDRRGHARGAGSERGAAGRESRHGEREESAGLRAADSEETDPSTESRGRGMRVAILEINADGLAVGFRLFL